VALEVVIAVDLGARPAAVVVAGTERAPVLLAVRRFGAWDTARVTGQIEEWLARWPGARIWCEETFTERRRVKRHLADVGRAQESQAGYLEGWAARKTEVRRVPPCQGLDGYAAWDWLGQPAAGRGAVGEHVRDACAIAIKALIEQGERRATK
jgi:hypothetical protein